MNEDQFATAPPFPWLPLDSKYNLQAAGEILQANRERHGAQVRRFQSGSDLLQAQAFGARVQPHAAIAEMQRRAIAQRHAIGLSDWYMRALQGLMLQRQAEINANRQNALTLMVAMGLVPYGTQFAGVGSTDPRVRQWPLAEPPRISLVPLPTLPETPPRPTAPPGL